ncbi:DeoR/GlpR family DNA-binding transcription regulator [uncultured Clostridium sp.]|uniref:DeoR/GlpR family DNA-binding transcription regulator n=1 Tax=uncultured Clostridium sp. TaxID=59620 RepID=UPI0028E1B658|nr:DeoR/GlpR family DNA-binding transcription regulator [uncultured Clostridium sp.]
MFIEERYKYILDLLEKSGKVLVKDLSKEFNVSESMIRKDLQALEKKNLLQRTYGGAINIKHSLASCQVFSKRIVEDINLKEVVAQKAFKQINENDTIFLDASTISYMIAKLIVKSDVPMTLITNMFEISSLIPENSKTHFIFIGGDYNAFVGGSIGSYSIEQIKKYRCNKAFLGCSGIDLSDGSISTTLSEDSCTKKAIISISKKLFLVMLNEKFKTNASFIFSNAVDFHSIITEALPDKSIINLLEEYYVTLI